MIGVVPLVHGPLHEPARLDRVILGDHLLDSRKALRVDGQIGSHVPVSVLVSAGSWLFTPAQGVS